MLTAVEQRAHGGNQWLALCEDLNALGQQMALPLEMTRRDNQKNLIVILYSRVLKLYQEILIFSRRGRLTKTRPMVHALIDSTFALAAVTKDASVCKAFIGEDDVQRIFRSKKHRPLPRDIGQSIQRITGRRLAERAGMEDYYKALTKMLIAPPDNTVVALTRDTEHGRTGGNSQGQGSEPGIYGLCDVLTPASEGVFLASRLVADFFGSHNLDEEFYTLWDSYHRLSKSL